MIEQAVILCGGRGTRLGALTAELPKPLLPIDEAPFLDLLLFELGRHGLRRILLLGGFAAARIAEYAAATPLKAAVRAEVVHRPEVAVAIRSDRTGPAPALERWLSTRTRSKATRRTQAPR